MSARTENERKAVASGRIAGQRGEPPFNNPFPHWSPLHTLWLDAWRDANAERKENENRNRPR